MKPPKVITAHEVHRIYCACGGYNQRDVAAATAYNKAECGAPVVFQPSRQDD